MVNFIEVLEDIGCFGFWDVSMYVFFYHNFVGSRCFISVYQGYILMAGTIALFQGFEEFCNVLCENYGGWRWSILSRFWRILGVLVLGMSVCMYACPCQFGTDLALVE